MPEFRVIKGGADTGVKRKSVASSKRVTEEQKRAANAAQGFGAGRAQDAGLDFDAQSAGFDAGIASGVAGVEDAAAQGAPASGAKRPRPTVSSKSKAAKAVSAFLIVASIVLAVALAAFAGYRWLYGNDGQDIQGSWYVNGTEAVMTFTDTEIILNDEVSYDYALNAANKTMSYQFNDLSGASSYRFSLDRGELAIIDGEASSLDTLKADFAWMLGALIHLVKGEEPSPAPINAENVVLLVRVPVEEAASSEPAEGEEAEGEAAEGETVEGEAAAGEADEAVAGEGEDADPAEGDAVSDLTSLSVSDFAQD